MKKMFFFLIAAIIIISNCGLNYLGNSGGESSETILVLSFNSYSVPNKTIIPDVTMDVVNYNVSGATTTGDNFNETVGIDGVLVLNDLAVGTWVIDVDAQNDADVIIADGNTSVEIQAGQIINKTVTVTPLDGPGTLSLTVDWTDASQFDSATVTGSLTPAGGSAVPITFNPSGVKAAAHTSSQNKGYYLLSTHVEEGSETWNFVDTVRIIYNETTSATIDVPDIENQGGLDLSIDNDLQNPIDITLDGVEDPLISGTNMTVTATCNPEPTTYQWYLDGVLLDGATSSFITIGSTLPERTGAYRLTLIVSLGEILSSESCNFTVADTPFCNLKKLINYDGPGNDMIWGTADDSINSYDLYGYNSDEEQIKTVCYDGPGDDLIWETADDSISKYFTYEYNSAGRMIKYVYYDGPGDDLIWETA
ncbi:MAG: hypothetical protein KAT05_03570, partial [Spirochaetes bacterium]|nr:hypothetical protein [Spirochaetota bacterium]